MNLYQYSLPAVLPAIPVQYTIAESPLERLHANMLDSLFECLFESLLESLLDCLFGSLLEKASDREE